MNGGQVTKLIFILTLYSFILFSNAVLKKYFQCFENNKEAEKVEVNYERLKNPRDDKKRIIKNLKILTFDICCNYYQKK
jgi:hypothetical protein